MTWKNLQLEILGEFTDVRWSGVQHAQLGYELPVVSDQDRDNWDIATRKADGDFTSRVLELAGERYTAQASELATEAGDTSPGGATSAGMVLATAGWTKTRGKTLVRVWVNTPRIMAWFAGRNNVTLGEAARETGVSVQTLSMLLTQHGWKKRRVSEWTWSAPESVETKEAV